MFFWYIKFDRDQSHGYLVFDANMQDIGIYDIDGNSVTGNIDYTTLEVNAENPSWADRVMSNG